MELKTIDEILVEGVKNNDVKPLFYKRIATHTKTLTERMQKDIFDQRKEIEDLKRSKSELENLVTIDTLTQINNRRSFEERYDLEIKRMKRKKTPLFLLIIDIDDFKNINDTFGHKVGDKILIVNYRLLPKALFF